MTNKELMNKIYELEQRIKELEGKQHVEHHTHHYYPKTEPYFPSPYVPSPWYPIWCGESTSGTKIGIGGTDQLTLTTGVQ